MTRTQFRSDGILGTLEDSDGNQVAVTIEHSYQQDDQSWQPKLPDGTYTCQRGQHMLHSGPIETFEILNVPNHTGVLLHPGNSEEASEGCVLLGDDLVFNPNAFIEHSKDAFSKFIALQDGLNTFTLTVTSTS